MKTILYDSSLFAGGGLVTYAAWLTAPPLAFLVAGAGLIAFGVLGAVKHSREKRR
jgi:hypothetical protein